MNGDVATPSRCTRMLARAAVVAVSLALVPIPSAAAQHDGPATVGTAVYVVIHNSFTEIEDPDQCVGAGDLATVRRGSSVVLSEGSPESSETAKVAVGQLFRSRMSDGVCEALYITSSPVIPAFNVQFSADGQVSPTFGPIGSQPVTDQPGIEQMIRVDLGFEPQP